ncbi:hypothetical protein DVH24_035246 [Malus domestica]|uniref:Uncharacterized protein n=1 Tax=Malus domestica TaxID=3750 RepID=A0A498J9F5_MALDO|nr:hypothetical protein DVH24_035246 [Malus domestica]
MILASSLKHHWDSAYPLEKTTMAIMDPSIYRSTHVSSPLKLRNTLYFQRFERHGEDEEAAMAVPRAVLLVSIDYQLVQLAFKKRKSKLSDHFSVSGTCNLEAKRLTT